MNDYEDYVFFGEGSLVEADLLATEFVFGLDERRRIERLQQHLRDTGEGFAVGSRGTELERRRDIFDVAFNALLRKLIDLGLNQAQDRGRWASKAAEGPVLRGFGRRGWMARVGLK